MIERNEPCWCGSGKKYKKCHLSSDEEKRAGPRKSVPARAGVKGRGGASQKGRRKTPAQIEGMRRGGAFNGLLLDYIRPHVKAGTVTEELNAMIHAYTVENGHIPACLGYKGHRGPPFPKSCCISRNNVVCHGIPSPNERLEEGDIVNIDLTTIVAGFHGDSSETFMIGAVGADARRLVDVAARALIVGIDAVRPGARLSAIGEAIEPFVNARGCSVVRQYTGHEIGTKFHESFSVYHHIEPRAEDFAMLPGMTFTIEPMINLGGFEVTTDKKDGWTVRTQDGSLSAQFEHTVLVTESGAEVLTLTPSQKAAGVRLIVGGEAYR